MKFKELEKISPLPEELDMNMSFATAVANAADASSIRRVEVKIETGEGTFIYSLDNEHQILQRSVQHQTIDNDRGGNQRGYIEVWNRRENLTVSN